MLVVLDTNKLISALVSRFGRGGLAYGAWRERRYEVVTCREQLAEVRQVSR
jgi:predicted nucleic acid-binding protein